MELRAAWVSIVALSGGVIAAYTGACSTHFVGGETRSDAGPTACIASAGTVPAPDCNGDTFCLNGRCAIDETTCGSKSTCLPMADNAGASSMSFRIRWLTVVAPPALATAVVQIALFDKSIKLDAGACGEKGNGGLNWLLQWDRAMGQLTTGGAPPSADPFGVGYCFARFTAAPSGARVAPVTMSTMLAGGSFSSSVIDELMIPIFGSGDPNPDLLLPLAGVAFHDVTVSPDGNCIGGFNAAALDDQCGDSRGDCSRWRTAGSIGGFITLEGADRIPVPQLGGKSLCVLLTRSPPDANGRCQRYANGQIQQLGDFCSTTRAPDGCADSFSVAATFAASAVRIGASSDPRCNGASADDAGVRD